MSRVAVVTVCSRSDRFRGVRPPQFRRRHRRRLGHGRRTPTHVDAKILFCDVADEESVAAAFDAIRHQHGDPTVLINNAGVTGSGGVLEESPEQWRRIIDVNLTGAYLCTRQVVAGMTAAGGGRIVNIASVNARFGGSPLSGPAYAASKGGLVTFTRFLALHHAADNITVNAVAPGPHDTPMWNALDPGSARAHPGHRPRRTRSWRPGGPRRHGGVPVRTARRIHHRRHHRRQRRPVDGLAQRRGRFGSRVKRPADHQGHRTGDGSLGGHRQPRPARPPLRRAGDAFASGRGGGRTPVRGPSPGLPACVGTDLDHRCGGAPVRDVVPVPGAWAASTRCSPRPATTCSSP